MWMCRFCPLIKSLSIVSFKGMFSAKSSLLTSFALSQTLFLSKVLGLYPLAKATMFLLGSIMDYREDKLSSRFVFDNPNEKSTCGCGESFSI